VTGATPAAPIPSALPAPEPPPDTCLVVPWLHPLKVWSLRTTRGGSLLPTRLGRQTIRELRTVLDDISSLGGEAGRDFVKALAKLVLKDPELGEEVGRRMVLQLRHLSGAMRKAGYGAPKFSADALVGMAIFMKKAKSQRRLANIFGELRDSETASSPGQGGHGGPVRHHQEGERHAEGIVERRPEGVRGLLARGAGTGNLQTSFFNSTIGQWHALSQMLPRIPSGAAVEALDSALFEYAGRPDLIVRIGQLLHQFELKWAKALLSGKALSQLHHNVEKAFERALRRVGPTASRSEILIALRDELERITYVFGEAGTLQTALRNQVRQEAAAALRWGYKSAAQSIGVLFEGKLP
jgi:hypothetical protein